MINVVEVKTKKQIKEFVEFPLNLYKNNPYFVPPLYADEKKLFTSKNIYNDQAKSVFFNAYKDGKIVGRIQGILQYVSNEKWNQKRVRFTRFDSIDDQEVANALFNALEDFAKANGMNELVGPLGYSDLDREGLLIEGFDELATFEEQYNYAYYQKLIENVGFEKEVDWVERNLKASPDFDPRVEKLTKSILKKHKLHFASAKNTKQFIKLYADQFFEIIDKTYNDLYMTVPFTKAMKDDLIKGFKLIININYVEVILDENNNVVCFGLCFPSIAKAVQKSGGRLTPACIARVLKAIKHPKMIDLALIGVLPEYAMKGVASSFIVEINRMLTTGGVESAETNLNLEDNVAIINQWKSFDARQHKRRRCFVKKL